MPAAIIAGGIAAVGGVASAAISSHAANNASKAAATAAANNNALQQDIYNKNTANLSPWMTRGNAAGNEQSGLLGLGGDPAAAQNAFNTFKGSDGYQFRLNQGLNAVNNNYATMGALNSGATLKGLNDYAQGQASNEFGKYMGYLGDMSQQGMAAGSAVAGVGQNYANAVSSNNNNAATAAGNAALASGNAWTGAINNAAGAIGGMFGSSYGGNKAVGGLTSLGNAFGSAMGGAKIPSYSAAGGFG